MWVKDGASEIQPQCELDLTAGTEADGPSDRGRDRAEGAGGGRAIRLAGLDLVRFGERVGRQRVGERRHRVREVRRVEQVEYLGAELDVARAGHREVLRHNQIYLAEVRPVEQTALEVAERARRRRRERRRVEEEDAAALDDRVDSRHEIRPPYVAQ